MSDELDERWVRTLPAPGKIEELIAVLRAHEVEVNPNLMLGWAIVYGREQWRFDALDTRAAPRSDREAWSGGPPSPMAGPVALLPLDVRMYGATEALVRQMS